MPRAGFAEILRRLARSEVEFIVVGMTAGVLRGAPVTTLDVDVVHRRSPDNVARLLASLRQMAAIYRHDARELVPSESHLMSPGHQLLRTSLGDLDCLGAIDEGRGYEELLAASTPISLGDGLSVRVLTLEALVDAKERSGRPKDLAVLPLLRATLEEQRRSS